MELTDKRAFAEVLNGMAAVYGKELGKEQLAVYWLAMSDWPLLEFKDAAQHLMQTCQFFPKPYDFAQLRKAFSASPFEAWEKAVGYAASGGWRRSVRCGDERIDRAIHAIGGFEALAMSDTNDHQWLSKKFMEAYGELAEVDERRDALPNFSESLRIGGMTSLKGIGKLIPRPGVEDDAA